MEGRGGALTASRRPAGRIRDAHSRYPRFFQYGDAESYRKGLERLQKEYEENGRDE